MISLIDLGFILLVHFIGDFILQSHEDAQNKWHSAKHLTNHVLLYATPLWCWCVLFWYTMSDMTIVNIYLMSLLWVGVNAILHWVTDYFTSKWTHKLWEEKRVHDFFVVIGFDQLIHYACLLITYYYVFLCGK